MENKIGNIVLLTSGGSSKVTVEEFLNLTVRVIVNAPYVVTFNIKGDAHFYVGNEEAYSRVEKKGFFPRWLNDLFHAYEIVMRSECLPLIDKTVKDIIMLSLIDSHMPGCKEKREFKDAWKN